MPEKISIVKESGETISSNIVSVFTIPDTEKKYIITTENSVDPHGLTVLHVSEIVDGSLKKIATDEEWSSIKTIMRAIISGNVGSYKYLPAIEVIKADGQYSRDISVSASASKQMVDNYNAADTSAEAEAEGSIFPDGEAKSETDEDNEVVPGISEVTDEPATTEVAPEAAAPAEEEAPATEENAEAEPAAPEVPVVAEAQAAATEEAAPVEEAPAPEAPVPDAVEPVPADPVVEVVQNAEAPEAAPAETTDEVAEPEAATPAEEEAPAVTVVTAPAQPVEEAPASEAPAVENVPEATENVAAPAPLNDDIQVVPTAETPATVEVVATPTPEAPAQQIEVVPTPVVVTQPVEAAPAAPEITVVAQPVEPVQPVVQVVQPAQTVPTAQIVQGVPETNITPPVQFDSNVTPSFKPDATLDEVVKGAQDMFMEGVKNLVQTIQEKVYRDLYIKEAEMKKREALVAQKEQMLNTQFAAMMSNITANFNGVGVLPTDPNSTTNPQG